MERLSLIHGYNQLLLPRLVSAEVREDLLVPSPLTHAYDTGILLWHCKDHDFVLQYTPNLFDPIRDTV